jgi:hypothetical protein
MMVLTERENADVTDTDMVTDWKLQPAAGDVVDEKKRKS